MASLWELQARRALLSASLPCTDGTASREPPARAGRYEAGICNTAASDSQGCRPVCWYPGAGWKLKEGE